MSFCPRLGGNPEPELAGELSKIRQTDTEDAEVTEGDPEVAVSGRAATASITVTLQVAPPPPPLLLILAVAAGVAAGGVVAAILMRRR